MTPLRAPPRMAPKIPEIPKVCVHSGASRHMPKSTSHDPERIAGILRKSHEKLASSMHADSPTHHVMSGFSDAYRAWLESVSAKPQTLLDLQGKYMQEQMNLWMKAFQPEARQEAQPPGDKRFSAPEWNELAALPLLPRLLPPHLEDDDAGGGRGRHGRARPSGACASSCASTSTPPRPRTTSPPTPRPSRRRWRAAARRIEEGMKNLLGRHGEGAHLDDRRGAPSRSAGTSRSPRARWSSRTT